MRASAWGFTPHELAILQDFCVVASRLKTAEALKDGVVRRSGIRWSTEEGWQVTSPLPEAQVRELLHLIRPFVLKKERTEYPSVTKLLGRRITDPKVRRDLREARKIFAGGVSRFHYGIFANGVMLNCEPVFHAWINGYEYHQDVEKRALIESLCPGTSFEFGRGLLVDILLDKALLVLDLATFLEALGSEADTR